MSCTERFVVSARKGAFKTELENILLADLYIHDALKDDLSIRKKSVRIVPFLRTSKQDLIADQEWIEKRYDVYIMLLSERLNRLHHTDYPSDFWYKCLNFGLKRHMTLLYDQFRIFKNNYNVSCHEIEILHDSCYYIPNDYDDLTNFLKGTDYGQEQLFSIFIKYFYPEKYQTASFYLDNFVNTSLVGEPSKVRRFRRIKSNIKTRFNTLFNLGYRNALILIINRIILKIVSSKAPKVGIVYSLFSPKNSKRLVLKSKGKIAKLVLKDFFSFQQHTPNRLLRDQLSNFKPDSDEFDQYFFYSLQYLMPKALLEGYKQVESYYKSYIEEHRQLKYIVSEGWVSQSFYSIALSIFKTYGVKHINNEHNFLSHPVLGNNISRTTELSDTFVTLGWHDCVSPKIVRGASLCELAIDDNYSKKYQILYISHFVGAKRTDFFGGYSMFTEDGIRYLKFQNDFFTALCVNIKQNILYRGYPAAERNKYLVYNESSYLNDQLKYFKIDDCKQPSKVMMRKSRLVILSYISTGLLEALIMNIPVIFFWDKDIYHLQDSHANFFNGLIDAGICQTDFLQAARFVESISSEPERWWHSERVQSSRNVFLNDNIGNSQVMIDYLISIVKDQQC